jgi:beta-lactamase class A
MPRRASLILALIGVWWLGVAPAVAGSDPPTPEEPALRWLIARGIVDGCGASGAVHCTDVALTPSEVSRARVTVSGHAAPGPEPGFWSDIGGVEVLATSVDAATRAEFARRFIRAIGLTVCPASPFTADREASLAARHPGVRVTAHVHDLSSGCAFSLHPERRQPTASVFKVMVMAGTLLEAQQAGRSPTAWEGSQLAPMITESANAPVRRLWRHFGGSPWFGRQVDVFGLDETTVTADAGSAWGRTRTSAANQVDLLRQVVVGEWGPLDEASRRLAWELMTSVVPDQTWGVTAGVPAGWQVAQKNGFAGVTANSVGVVADAGGEPRYVVAVLTTGWSNWRDGVATVEEVAGWAAEAVVGDQGG